MYMVFSLRIGCLRVSRFFPSVLDAAEHCEWLEDMGHYQVRLIGPIDHED